MRILYIVLFILFSLCLLPSCQESGGGSVVAEKDEPAFRRGKDHVRRSQPEEALTQFLDVIERRMRVGESAPESELEVGVIYLNHFEDPVEAIHHFRKFLALKPNAPQKDKVKELIQTAKKEFAKKLPGQPYGENMDRMDVMDLFKQVREENLQLKRQLALARDKIKDLGGGAFVTAVVEENKNDPDLYVSPDQVRNVPVTQTTETPSVYIVQSGDSLYRISSRVYGSGSHWKSIFEANRDQLTSPQSLRPGMELRIPPNPRN